VQRLFASREEAVSAEPVQDFANMVSAFVFSAIFIGAGLGLVGWWMTGKLFDWLDGNNGEMERYCGFCLRKIEDMDKWRKHGCECGGSL
jgi:hypothetical protein